MKILGYGLYFVTDDNRYYYNNLGMFNYFTSFGASSAFEKNRLILTSRNLDAP
jgi:hypothetical protein